MIRISKRNSISFGKSALIRGIAIFLSLIATAIVILAIVGLNPIDVYVSMAKGTFGDPFNLFGKRFQYFLRDMMILTCIAIGLAPAFKMRFWNVGAEGQMLVGAIGAMFFMRNFAGKMPDVLLFVCMIAAALLLGGIWGLIPGFFKAKWNTNETLFTLMMNYIAIRFTAYCVAKWENPFGSNTVGIVNSDTKTGWIGNLLSKGYNGDYLWTVLIVLALCTAMWAYLRYSKQGYEIAVVGESENTARYAGINVRRVTVRTMLISGAICGLCGFLIVAGKDQTISTASANGRGFTAIIVAWLAKFNTFYMALISFLLVFLERGASEIASAYSLNEYAADIITGIILFFILGSEFFINYRVIPRGAHKEGK